MNPSCTREVQFLHDLLGPIIGLTRQGDIVQFRGLPFATIPRRFAQSELKTSLPHTPFDARFPGPICPQVTLPYPQFWDGPVPQDIPALPVPEISEWECLNLNITVPATILGMNRRVPVLFFLHGGGLVGGSQSIQVSGREIYDPTNLVRTSVAQGEPLIVVTANYRVGPLGFLASAELMADNVGGMGISSKPVGGNYGLHDQRRALEWCARFISGFGGDPSNITLHGSSAGGVSCHYHCAFPPRREPLFRRAILSSGTFISCRPMPLQYHQEIFDGYVREATRMSHFSMGPKDPVDLLRSASVDELLASTPQGVRWTMYADNVWIKDDMLRAYQESPEPKPDLIIGSAEYERENPEHHFSMHGDPLPQDEILSRAASMLNTNHMPLNWSKFPAAYPKIIAAFGLEDHNTAAGSPHAFKAWANLLADMTFRVPPMYLAQMAASATAYRVSDSGGQIFLYSIHATNPFPAWPAAYRRANHAINETFLFDVASDRVPIDHQDEYRGTVVELQRTWIEFCHGKSPWSRALNGYGPMYVFRNGTKSEECATVRAAEGDATERRWAAIMEAANQ